MVSGIQKSLCPSRPDPDPDRPRSRKRQSQIPTSARARKIGGFRDGRTEVSTPTIGNVGHDLPTP